MGNKINYETMTQDLLIEFANSNSIEIVDVEFIKEGRDYYLRIYIDKDGGVNIDDCEKISRYIDPILDEKNFISQQYILEVSSPGLTRKLKKDKDFQRHIGDYVELKLFKPHNSFKNFIGILSSYDEHTITLKFEENEEIKFEKNNIKVVRLAIVN